MTTLPKSFVNEFDFTKKYFQIDSENSLYIIRAINYIVGLDKNDYGVLDAYVEIEDEQEKSFSFTYINNVEMDLFLHILSKYNNIEIEDAKKRISFENNQTQKQFFVTMTNEEYFNVFMVYEFHRIEMKASYKKYLKQNIVEITDKNDVENLGIGSINKQRKLAQSEFTFLYLNRVGLIEEKTKSDILVSI